MHEVPASWIRHVVRQCGPGSAVAAGALAAAGLPPAVLSDETERAPAKDFVTFVEQAARLARDDTFGLTLGLSYDIRNSGLAAYLSIAAATLREAMQNAARYGAINDTGADYALREAGAAASFRIESHNPRLRGPAGTRPSSRSASSSRPAGAGSDRASGRRRSASPMPAPRRAGRSSGGSAARSASAARRPSS